LINRTRGTCGFSAAPDFDAAHGSVNEVDKESVLQRAIAGLRGPEHGLARSGRDGGGGWLNSPGMMRDAISIACLR
jgi:hypothetical protein